MPRARILLASMLSVLSLVLVTDQPALSRASTGATGIVFVGGYGSDLVSASSEFASLRAELGARDEHISFVQYSYAGWDSDGCGATPPPYGPGDTAQDLESSKRTLIFMLQALRSACGLQRIAVIGHSLGGLVAFHALADQPVEGVSDLVTIDSPLGGASRVQLASCVEVGLCSEGPITAFLADLNVAWAQTAADNAARVARLEAAGTRVSAWGNQSDCLYDLSRCLPFARGLLARYDSRETQWLGIQRAFRRDYPPSRRLASMLSTHHMLLVAAASDIAADVLT
jgi:pimeloyl-ACP methyl ester carboxylesterase